MINNGDECSKMDDLLHDYSAGQTDTESTAKVEAHLAQCEKCRDKLEWIRCVNRSLTKAVPVPSQLIRKGLAEKISAVEKAKNRNRYIRLGSMAASLVLVCGALIFGGKSLMYHQDDMPQDNKTNVTNKVEEYLENVTAPRHDSAALMNPPARYPGEMYIGSGMTEIMQDIGIRGVYYGNLCYYVLNTEEKSAFDNRITQFDIQLFLYEMGPGSDITANSSLTEDAEEEIRDALAEGKTVILDVGAK